MDRLVPSASISGANASYTGTAGTTSAFQPGPRGVLVWTTTDAYVKVGVSVTATTAALPIPAYTPVVIDVSPDIGEPWVVSAIQISAGGTVYAKPLQA